MLAHNMNERALLRHRRRAAKTRARKLLGGALVVVLCGAGVIALAQYGLARSNNPSWHRQLTASDNTNNATIATPDHDDDADTSSCAAALAPWERNGGIAVYIGALLYLFVALAIICDDYFVNALEQITERLGLSKDVAGATFMAAGSSAPELFVSLADNVLTKPRESLGIGTVVGSAIFNILVIIALSALLAGQVLVLDWRPLLRDSLWYSFAIVLLTYSVYDGHVDVVESACMFGAYVWYIAFMTQNERIVQRCCKRPDALEVDLDSDTLELVADGDVEAALRAAALVTGAHTQQTLPITTTTTPVCTTKDRAWTIDVAQTKAVADIDTIERNDATVELRRTRSNGSDHTSSDARSVALAAQRSSLSSSSFVNPMFQSKYRMFQYHTKSFERQATQDESDTTAAAAAAVAANDPSITTIETQDVVPVVTNNTAPLGRYFDEVWDVPSTLVGKLWFGLTRPIVVLARMTIPDCRFPPFDGPIGVTATFVVSILWIAVLSHFTVVWATKVGCLAGVPPSLMGLTLVAAGTSVPDALSSILVARDGHGDMAVSNALGSNVFDILLGLGLPFFVSNLVYNEPVAVAADDLEFSIAILFGILVVLVALLIASRWRLRKTVGALLLLLYVVYVVVSYLRGLGRL